MNKSDKQIIFTATSGRSGTTTLTEIFRKNVENCRALHEPWVDPAKVGIPNSQVSTSGKKILEGSGFGKALSWYDNDDEYLNRLIEYKSRQIKKLKYNVYLEANHAFLKSMCDLMIRQFPKLSIIHLTRDPLEVARSYVNRHSSLEHDEFLHRFGRWSMLPGYKKNCLTTLPAGATPIQYYLWSWIELELRLVRFLEHHPETNLFELDINEMGEENKITEMFKTLGIHSVRTPVYLPTAKNRNPEPTCVSDQDRMEATQFLRTLPNEILIRIRNPYNLFALRELS